jgi:hypothetical protein
MQADLHNDLLPLLFAGVGIYLATRCHRAPVSAGAALALQAVPLLGLWTLSFFC